MGRAHPLAAAALLSVVALSSSARADANSLFDYFGPRELALGESMRANATGAAAITLNPAGLSMSRELVFEGSYGYRDIDSADSLTISACDSTVPVPGCFYYRYFTADGGRRVHEAGYLASRAITPTIAIGVNNKYFDYEDELEETSGYAADLGLIFMPSTGVQLGVAGYNLLRTEESSQYPRGTGVGLVLRPTSGLTLGLDAMWHMELEDDEKSGRYGGGIEYFLLADGGQSGYPLRAGTVHDRTSGETYVTAGVGYRTMKVGLDLGARRAVDGGDELTVLGSIRLFAPTPGAE